MMPRPAMPAPAPPTKPKRRPIPGADLSPDITLFRSEDGDTWLAVLKYNGVFTHVTRSHKQDARDAAFQFYLEHTAAGRAGSEVV